MYETNSIPITLRIISGVDQEALKLEFDCFLSSLKMKSKRIVTVIFSFFCVVGMGYQISLICHLFFRYKVSTQIRVFIPKMIEPRYLTFCARYTDVLDYDRLNRETGRNWSFSNVFLEVKERQSNISVSEIFDFTPSPDEAVTLVIFRGNKSAKLRSVRGKEVYDHLKVDKFVYTEMICYRILRINATPELYTKLSVSPMFSGLIFEVNLTHSLQRSNIIRIVIHQGYPYRSLLSSDILYTGYDKMTKTFKLSHFDGFAYDLDVHSLSAPFETDCFEYQKIGFESEVQCADLCTLKETLKAFNKLPFTIIAKNRTPLKMICQHDMDTNNTIDETFTEIQNYCTTRPLCRRSDCKISNSITQISSKPGRKNYFLIRNTVPFHPSVEIKTYPYISLIEFGTYCLSAISTWTGLSVLRLNPILILSKLKSFRRSKKISPDSFSRMTSLQNSIVRHEKLIRRLLVAKNTET